MTTAPTTPSQVEYVGGMARSVSRKYAAARDARTKYERVAFAFVTENLKFAKFAALMDVLVRPKKEESVLDTVPR